MVVQDAGAGSVSTGPSSAAPIGKSAGRPEFDATGLIAKIVYYFVLLIALQLAFGVFGASNPVSTLLNEVIAYLPRIIVAMVLVIVASAIGTAPCGTF